MCVIVYAKINGKQFLIKNRDRTYNPKIEIIHEIVNDIEIVYINDLITGWREGMNAEGVGLINSSMTTTGDDNKSLYERVRRNPEYLKKRKFKTKGDYIYDILIDNHFKSKIHSCIEYDNCRNIPEGHDLILINKDVFHVEKFKKKDENDFLINKLNINTPIVITNHGIYGNGGYIKGKAGVSSFLRKHIVEYELAHQKIHSLDDLLNIINTNYINIDPRFHPYRDGNISKRYMNVKNKKDSKYISTTSQIVMNMTDKVFDYYSDIHHTSSVKYINKLPKFYQPKIQVNIHSIQKNMDRKKHIFNPSYLNQVYKKFDYRPNRNYTRKHITKKHPLHNHKKTRKRNYFNNK